MRPHRDENAGVGSSQETVGRARCQYWPRHASSPFKPVVDRLPLLAPPRLERPFSTCGRSTRLVRLFALEDLIDERVRPDAFRFGLEVQDDAVAQY